MPPSDEVLTAVISTFGVILTGLFGYLAVVATGARRHAKAARHQVQNSHEVNLRDDLDEKFKGLADLVKGLADDVSGVKDDIGGVKKDVGGIKEDIRIIHRDAGEDRRALDRERERIRELEQTRPPARRRAAQPKEKP